MKPKTERYLIIVLCAAGVCSIAFGMTRRNHPAFLAGLALVVAGYLLIRRKLKGG